MFTYQNSIISLIILVLLFLPIACEKSPPPFECTDDIGCVDIKPGKPLKIGVLQAVSGGAATIGKTQVRSIELASSQRGNQLLGHPIVLQLEDTRCLAEGGNAAALKVIADPQVLAILGTTCSGSGVTASQKMSEAGLVMISASNTTPSLTSIDGRAGDNWQPGYFRTIYNDIEQGRAAAIFAFQELGLTKAATINDGDIYTQELTKMFEQAFRDLGGEIVLTTAINKGDTNMHPVLAAVTNSGAEIVFIPIFPPEGVCIVQQAKEISGLEDIILIGAGSLVVKTFLENVKADGIEMYFTISALFENAMNDTFIAEHKRLHGEIPQHYTYAYAYDAANMLFNALEIVAVQEEDGTLHIGRQALRDKLYATSAFSGVTGTLSCSEFGDCGVVRLNILQLEDPVAGLEGLLSNVVYTYAPKQ